MLINLQFESFSRHYDLAYLIVMSYDEVCLGVTLIYTDFLFFGCCVTGASVPFLFDFLVFEIFVSRGSYSVRFYLKKYTTKET